MVADEDHERSNAVVTQRGCEGGWFSSGHEARRRGIARLWARDRKGAPSWCWRRLVDEDDLRRIEVDLPFKPRLTRRVHRAAALFGGVRRLFLRVILRRLKNRQSVPLATGTPRSFSEGLGLLENWLGCTLPESQQEGGLSVGAVGPEGASRWRDYPPRSVRARSFAR
jgi:hypothetical protein